MKLVCLHFLLLVTAANAFRGPSLPRKSFLSPDINRRRKTTPTSLFATEKLIFKGDYKATTPKLPEGTTKDDVAKFLTQLPNRNIFLSAGGTRKTQELPMTEQFKGYWEDICKHFHSDSLPSDNDKLIAVATEVKFPGLKLVTTSVSGVKELYSDDDDGRYLKGLEILLVAEKSEPKGAAPIVWLFNKLTANNDREKGVFYPPKQSKARSLICAEPLEDGSLTLSFTLDMQVTIEFPSVLMKILPSSKEKMEQQGSASILKTVSKDIDMAMLVAYEKFVEERLISMKAK